MTDHRDTLDEQTTSLAWLRAEATHVRGRALWIHQDLSGGAALTPARRRAAFCTFMRHLAIGLDEAARAIVERRLANLLPGPDGVPEDVP